MPRKRWRDAEERARRMGLPEGSLASPLPYRAPQRKREVTSGDVDWTEYAERERRRKAAEKRRGRE